jgi:D-galactarolactone cycloisomerase
LSIASVETFVLRYAFSPRRGPADAWGSSHEYCLVRIADSDGAVGWGESYVRPGLEASIHDIAAPLIGRSPFDALANWQLVWGSGEFPFAASAVAISLDDLRGRLLGASIADLHGGRRRDRVRAYAAHQGYVEGVDPAMSWPADAEAAAAAGFAAMKIRIGRYPIAHEVPILERLAARELAGMTLLSDASGAYTPSSAIEMGRQLERLGFAWFEGPLYEWEGYVGYELLPPALDIPIAGAEVTFSRSALREQLERGAFDIVQPDPVICGGIGEVLFYAALARLHAVSCVPHTSGGAIGIAAALQALAALPDPTSLPLSDPPILELGMGENPWRTDVLADGWRLRDGWVDIPRGPGLGIEVDEAFVRSRAQETHLTSA